MSERNKVISTERAVRTFIIIKYTVVNVLFLREISSFLLSI